eukprot:Nitzschia sp. Nitz4//scaffold38_size140716//125668//126265//NITZ4_003172-RA/size140716-augustus-gene-0.140-mRNA-1//-1//CDS//3329550153//1009//frame0
MSGAETKSEGGINNPYKSEGGLSWQPIHIMSRMAYAAGSLGALRYFDTYEKIMHDPKISHEWFKVGLASSIAIVFLKAYVEMYAGKLKKQKVNYKNFRTSTHAIIGLILLSSVAFHVALWPAFGSKTFVIMSLVGMFLLNFCLLLPTYVQNIAAFGVLAFFLQEYS